MGKSLKTQIGGQSDKKKKQAVIFAVVAFAVLVVATAIVTLTPIGSFITGSYAKQVRCPAGTSQVCAHSVVRGGKTYCAKYQCTSPCPKDTSLVCTGTYANAKCSCVRPTKTPIPTPTCQAGYIQVCTKSGTGIGTCKCLLDTRPTVTSTPAPTTTPINSRCPTGYTQVCLDTACRKFSCRRD